MTSSAIPAQGSTLQIGTGTGPAVNITGLALGFPTIVKAVGHPLKNGDIVSFAGLTGNAALNGLSPVIKNVTADTFAVDVDTTGGAAYTNGGTATPVAWTKISNLLTYKGFDGQAADLDATNLDSDAKEFKPGLQDWGQFTVDYHKDFSDPGQQALDAAKAARAVKPFKFTLPNGKTRTFNALVKNSPIEGGVDQLVKAAGVALRISGNVVEA